MFYNSVIWHYGVAVTFSSPLGMVKRQGCRESGIG